MTRETRRHHNTVTASVVATAVLLLAWSFFIRRQIPFNRAVWLDCQQHKGLDQRYRMKDDLIRMLKRTSALTADKVMDMLGSPDLCWRYERRGSPSQGVSTLEYAIGRQFHGPMPIDVHRLRIKFTPQGSVYDAYLTSG